jgi:hypothetical protein
VGGCSISFKRILAWVEISQKHIPLAHQNFPSQSCERYSPGGLAALHKYFLHVDRKAVLKYLKFLSGDKNDKYQL